MSGRPSGARPDDGEKKEYAPFGYAKCGYRKCRQRFRRTREWQNFCTENFNGMCRTLEWRLVTREARKVYFKLEKKKKKPKK